MVDASGGALSGGAWTRRQEATMRTAELKD